MQNVRPWYVYLRLEYLGQDEMESEVCNCIITGTKRILSFVRVAGLFPGYYRVYAFCTSM